MATTPRKPAAPKPSAKPKSAAKPRTKTAASADAAPKPKPAAKPRAKAAARKPAAATPKIGALTIGASLAALGAAALGIYRYVTRRPAEGVVPTDLMGDSHPDGSERAIPEFRPDPTAEIPAGDREQFRPALVRDSGNRISG